MVVLSRAFNNFNRGDLGSVLAYHKTAPPVDRVVPPPTFTPLAHVMLAAGVFGNLFPATRIDHANHLPPMPQIGANLAFGQHFARFCQACHGENLSGAPADDPPAPPAANLTLGGELVGWNEADFATPVRTGATPSGRHLDEVMPFKIFSDMTDDEVNAVWLYLKPLPAKPFNSE